MKDWLENFVKELVQFPDQVSASQKDGIQTNIISVKVASEDFPLFKGKNNRLTRSMNIVAGLAGARTRKRYVVKFVE